VISKSIETDVLTHPSHVFSEEDVLIVRCAPQSVFKVRPTTRCCGHTFRYVHCLYIESYRSILMTLCIRTFIANIVRFVFPYWQSTSDWLGRHSRSPVEPVYRNTITHVDRSYRVGSVRGMGSARTQIGKWRSRWPCKAMGS
jgi:hypothetical protein